MESTDRAVVRLTEAHTEHEGGVKVERSALLVELTDSATAQSGRGGGNGGAGIPINLGVLALQDRIDGKLRLMREAFHLDRVKDAVVGTREVWAVAKNERAGDRVSDEAWERITRELELWVKLITDEVLPPTSTEILAACNECGEKKAWVRGDRVSAVVVKWYPDELDRAPIAKCRFCEHEGVGWGYMHYDMDVVNIDVLGALGIKIGAFEAKV